MLEYKEGMSPKETRKFEEDLRAEFLDRRRETDEDLNLRKFGVKATRGSTGFQFAGYNTLEQFYRGDQWDHDEPAGASQSTDNYCATIVDNFSSLLFDAPVEINCPSQDPTDDVLEMKAEIKEKLLYQVYQENDADDIIFPETSKCGSEFGDAFIKGPMLDKCGSKLKKDWKIVFYNVDNPANIRPIFDDGNHKKLAGFIDTTEISPSKAKREYGSKLAEKGIDVDKLIKGASKRPLKSYFGSSNSTAEKGFLKCEEYWTDKIMVVFLEDEIVEWFPHNQGFVPLHFIKNVYVPNHKWGKSDLEDALDPQMAHTRANNDLANALKFLSSVNLVGKNLEGMEVVISGLQKIFNIPDDGELEAMPRSGDAYASNNFVNGRRAAILDISGVSDALMAASSNTGMSGRALSIALQSVIRRLNPKIKRYQKSLRDLNKDIFILMEKYWPETKEIIMGDYTSEVNIISTLLRNIIDELNKMQSGVQSLTTTQKNLGIPQPRIEQKLMRKDLSDPILGPQIARQPGMLQIAQAPSEGGMPPTEGTDGNQLPPAGNQMATSASPEGAVAATNQRSTGAAIPTNPIIP